MTIFQLKHICPPAADHPIHWTYDRAELIADGIVHAFGVTFGLIGAVALFLMHPTSTGIDGYVALYAVGLITMCS